MKWLYKLKLARLKAANENLFKKEVESYKEHILANMAIGKHSCFTRSKPDPRIEAAIRQMGLKYEIRTYLDSFTYDIPPEQ